MDESKALQRGTDVRFLPDIVGRVTDRLVGESVSLGGCLVDRRAFRAALREVDAHALRDYPIMACGFLLIDQSTADFCQVNPVANQERSPYHFLMDEGDQARILGEVLRTTLKIGAIYYSQRPAPALLSSTTRRLAQKDLLLESGQISPVWRRYFLRLSYLVVAVDGTRVPDRRIHTWNEVSRDYDEQQLAVIDEQARALLRELLGPHGQLLTHRLLRERGDKASTAGDESHP
jgi:proteasome lid subunit RPN8/RPN11